MNTYIKDYINGILLVGTLVLLSVIMSKALELNNIFISSAIISIVLGLIIGNSFGINNQINVFADLCLKKILRIGIALLGIGLSLNELIEYGSLSIILININKNILWK